jgi:hypothetical protein
MLFRRCFCILTYLAVSKHVYEACSRQKALPWQSILEFIKSPWFCWIARVRGGKGRSKGGDEGKGEK